MSPHSTNLDKGSCECCRLQEGSRFCHPWLKAVGTQSVLSAPPGTFLPLGAEAALKLSPRPFHLCISALPFTLLLLMLCGELSVPAGRSSVCWTPFMLQRSFPTCTAATQCLRTGQNLRASSWGIVLVLNELCALRAGAVDAVGATAALCLLPLCWWWGFDFKFPHGTNRGGLRSGSHIRKRAPSIENIPKGAARSFQW